MSDMETIQELKEEEEAVSVKDTLSVIDAKSQHRPKSSRSLPTFLSYPDHLDELEEGQVVQIITSNKNCKNSLSSATCVCVTATNQLYLGNTVGGGYSVYHECGESLMEFSTIRDLVSGDVCNMKMSVDGKVVVSGKSATSVAERDRGVMARAFDLKGTFLYSFLHPDKDSDVQSKYEEVDECVPHGLAVTSDNRLIVTDIGNHRIFIFDEDQALVKKFGKKGTGKYRFRYPYYACVNEQDDIYISDYGNHCIKVHNKNGKYKFEFGNCGKKTGQLSHPLGICVDHDNNIVVADRDNHRVQLFARDGTPLMTILPDTRTGGVDTRPIDVSVSPQGHLIVLIKGVPGETHGRVESHFYKPHPVEKKHGSKTCSIL